MQNVRVGLDAEAVNYVRALYMHGSTCVYGLNTCVLLVCVTAPRVCTSVLSF